MTVFHEVVHDIQSQVLCEVFTEPHIRTSVRANRVGLMNIPAIFP